MHSEELDTAQVFAKSSRLQRVKLTQQHHNTVNKISYREM